LIRRYGAREPTVAQALLRLLTSCAALSVDDADRWSAIEEQAQLLVADAEREVTQAADLAVLHAEADALRAMLATRRSSRSAIAEQSEDLPTAPPPT
jgi:uncharacterized membrane protein